MIFDDEVPVIQGIEKDGAVVQALRVRRQDILDNIRDNDETGINYQKVMLFPVLRVSRVYNTFDVI